MLHSCPLEPPNPGGLGLGGDPIDKSLVALAGGPDQLFTLRAMDEIAELEALTMEVDISESWLWLFMSICIWNISTIEIWSAVPWMAANFFFTDAVAALIVSIMAPTSNPTRASTALVAWGWSSPSVFCSAAAASKARTDTVAVESSPPTIERNWARSVGSKVPSMATPS